MFTIISFILTLIGSINWLMIGLLQYDFIAGIFGYQASIFSRIIYIIIGASSAFLIYKLIKGKGTIAVFSKRNKENVIENINKLSKKHKLKNHYDDDKLENIPANVNVEANDEFANDEFYLDDSYDEFYKKHQNDQNIHRKSLLDEYLDDK